MELKNFLSRWSAESRMFLSRCISVERSEDTLQRLLEKVNRVPLHEDFHFRVTNGQRAEASGPAPRRNISDFRVRFAIKKFFALQAYHSNKYKFTPFNLINRQYNSHIRKRHPHQIGEHEVTGNLGEKYSFIFYGSVMIKRR